MNIMQLGEATYPSPIRRTVGDDRFVPERIVRQASVPLDEGMLFELAGPRPKLFFDPKQARAGIVTCGGLCPGLNDVIRSLFLQLHPAYGVSDVLGFRGGYQGLDPARGAEPLALTADVVDDIHKEGGTILGTSRGPVDITVAVDNLIRRGVNMVIGYLHNQFIHVPIELLATQKKRLDPNSFAWSAVLAATGQPERFE